MAKTFKRNYRGRMEWVLYQRPLFLNGVAFLVLVFAWLVRMLTVALDRLGVVLDWLSVFSFWFLLVAFLVVLLVLTVRVVRFAKDLKTFGGYSGYMTHRRAIKDVEKGLLSAGLVRKIVGESVVDVPACDFLVEDNRTVLQVEKLPSVSDVAKVAEAVNSSLRTGKYAGYAVSEPIQTADGLYYRFELADVTTDLSYVPRSIEDLVPEDPYRLQLMAGNEPLYWDYPSQPHAIISGLTGSYKTTTALALLAQALGAGADVYILDYKQELSGFKKILGSQNVALDKGGLDHYQADSINGHLVLTERGGEVSDVDKVKELKRAGATGVIFYQTEEQGNNPVGFDLEGLGERFPVGVIGHAAGLVLAQHANDYQLHIANKFKRVPYDAANQLSDFSSWGLSADGDLKPDVTLPGGMIYSSVNNGEYYMDRGTSMASPHAAGATALVKQALKERFPHLSPEQLQVLVKQMTMSTAIPHVDEQRCE